jgi:hypothetical protein
MEIQFLARVNVSSFEEIHGYLRSELNYDDAADSTNRDYTSKSTPTTSQDLLINTL